MKVQPTTKPLAWFKVLFVLLGLIYLGLFFWQPIHLPTADIGRHITNGQVILAEGLQSAVLRTNFYSLTEPDTPVINHHWLFGVLSAAVFQVGNFAGLSLLAAFLQLLTIGLIVWFSIRLYGWRASLVATIVALPLITQRTEVRPELISSLLLTLSLLTLTAFHTHTVRFRWLLCCQLLIQLIWVNMHLFFVFNFALISMFAIFDKWRWRQWLVVLLSTLTISLLNPSTWHGLLAPLSIFSNYEYAIAENQSVWFLWDRLRKPIYLYILGGIGILTGALTLWLVTMKQQRWRTWRQAPSAPITILALIFGLATLIVFRVMPYFGLLLIPATASLLHHARWRSWFGHYSLPSEHGLIILPTALILFMGLLLTGLFTPTLGNFGIGISPSNQRALVFLQEHVPAPIFNNYDIGGMLIFALYPKQPVYVDNRPEAYPTGFFPDRYITPQEDERSWRDLLDQHQFQAIVFHRHDMTPWAQPFLIRRVADPDWQPIYVDEDILILVRDTQHNRWLIDKFGLPKELFTSLETVEYR